MGLGPAAAFLTEVIEPPPPKAVRASLEALVEVGALTLAAPAVTPSEAAGGGGGGGAAASAGAGAAAASAPAPVAQEEALTPLGRHLALLPLEPRLGKLLVMGACLGCLAPALVRRAGLSCFARARLPHPRTARLFSCAVHNQPLPHACH